MTAGQAIEQADELRPNNQFTDSLKQSWLVCTDCAEGEAVHGRSESDRRLQRF